MLTGLMISSPCIQALSYDDLLNNLKNDAIYYPIEALNIAMLNNKNDLQIKSSALASFIKNIYFSIVNFSIISKAIEISKKDEISKSDLYYYLLTNLYCGIENIKFSFYDQNRFRKSNQLALKKPTSSTNQKTKQAIWLAINMFLPYITLAIKRLTWDKTNIKHALYCNSNESMKTIDESYYFFNIFHTLTLFSENIRRSLLYKQILKDDSAKQNIIS